MVKDTISITVKARRATNQKITTSDSVLLDRLRNSNRAFEQTKLEPDAPNIQTTPAYPLPKLVSGPSLPFSN